MKLSLNLIAESLSGFDSQVILSTDREFEFSSVQILTLPTDTLEEDVLYICEPKVLPRLKRSLFHDHCFIFKAKPSQVQCKHPLNGIRLGESTVLNDVTNHLINLFSKFNQFEFRVKAATLSHGGYNALLQIASEMFPGCLLLVTDSAYNIVCATRKSVDCCDYLNNIVTRGYYSQNDLNLMAQHGYYEDERKYFRPILYGAETTISGVPFLVRSYRSNGASFSFLGCYFLESAPSLETITLFTCLSNELETYYKLNGLFGSEFLATQQQFVGDLIHPKQDSVEYFRDRCAQLHIPFQGRFRLGLVQCDIDSSAKVSHLANQLRANCPLPSYGVFQHGTEVLILLRDWNASDVKDASTFDDDWNTLNNTLSKNQARMGVSPMFPDVTKLHVAYKQALAALSCGVRQSPEKTSFLYSRFYLEDMLQNYAQEVPLEDVYIRYLDRLMDDNSSTCSNIKLLYYYLCSERNISLTAKNVHMHRNSVIYRIQKIQDILALNLDDPDIRLRLMVSFKVLEMLNKIPHWDVSEGAESIFALD